MSVAQMRINRAIHAEFLDIIAHLAYDSSVTLTQVVVRRTSTGWQTIVKGDRYGKPVASYIDAETFAEAIELTGWFCVKGALDWHPDKYPPKR